MVVLPITTVMTNLRSSFDELRESLLPASNKGKNRRITVCYGTARLLEWK